MVLISLNPTLAINVASYFITYLNFASSQSSSLIPVTFKRTGDIASRDGVDALKVTQARTVY